MKNINKTVDQVEKFIGKVINDAEAPVKKVLDFVKKHKKLIFMIVVAYLVFKYVFGEDGGEAIEED